MMHPAGRDPDGVTIPLMRAWQIASALILVAGVVVAFLIVPYSGGCDDVIADCPGSGPRVLTRFIPLAARSGASYERLAKSPLQGTSVP